MVYRPFRSLGRLALAACAVSLGVASLGAQTAPSTTAPLGPNPSRIDVFTGYSYFGAHGQDKPVGIQYSSIDEGAIGSGAYYFSKYVGGEINFVAHPDGNNDGLYSASAGPDLPGFRCRTFTLFAHGLAGGAKPWSVRTAARRFRNYHKPLYLGARPLTAGGRYGTMIFRSSTNRFSLRLFRGGLPLRFTLTSVRRAMVSTGGRANLSGVDLSTGIVTHFGPHHSSSSCDLCLRRCSDDDLPG